MSSNNLKKWFCAMLPWFYTFCILITGTYISGGGCPGPSDTWVAKARATSDYIGKASASVGGESAQPSTVGADGICSGSPASTSISKVTAANNIKGSATATGGTCKWESGGDSTGTGQKCIKDEKSDTLTPSDYEVSAHNACNSVIVK
ncbi:MAG: hypothetical protein AB1546_11460 [bacterium]